jgi:CelD/BcsL family acetyltransferase involved in cellulose biosynthesis
MPSLVQPLFLVELFLAEFESHLGARVLWPKAGIIKAKFTRRQSLSRFEHNTSVSGCATTNPNVDGESAFEDVRSAWNALSSGARYFFQTLPWVELIARRVTSDVLWSVTLRNGRAIFVSVLRRRLFPLGGIRLRVLTSLCPLPQMTPFADSLVDSDAVAQLHFDDIARGFGPWHALRLRGLRAESPWLKVSAENVKIVSEPRGGVGIFDTSSSFEERWASVPKKMRKAIRRARDRIGERGQFVVATGDAIAKAFDEFVALESAGWKGEAGTSLAQTPGEREFLREYLVTADSAEVRSLHIDGRLAASRLAVKVAGTLFVLKTAYDESVADLAPGNVLFADLIEACCEDTAVNRVDCIVWHSRYEQWGMTREPTYMLLAFNRRSVGGMLAMIAWSLRPREQHRKAVKAILKCVGDTSLSNKLRAAWHSMRK